MTFWNLICFVQQRNFRTTCFCPFCYRKQIVPFRAYEGPVSIYWYDDNWWQYPKLGHSWQLCINHIHKTTWLLGNNPPQYSWNMFRILVVYSDFDWSGCVVLAAQDPYPFSGVIFPKIKSYPFRDFPKKSTHFLILPQNTPNFSKIFWSFTIK